MNIEGKSDSSFGVPYWIWGLWQYLKLSWHEKHIKEVSPRVETSKEWLMEVKRSSKAIQILSPSTAMPYSLRGTNMKALHNPIVGTSIMSEFLAKNLLSNMPLIWPINSWKVLWDYFWIARAMPVVINENEVRLDFHIFAILEFNLLIGYPLDKLFKEKPSHGSLDEKFWKTAFTTH